MLSLSVFKPVLPQSRSYTMAAEGSAVQFMAVKLVERPDLQARMALLGEVSPLVEAVIGGMDNCPMNDDPLFLEIYNSCDRLQKFLVYFSDWYHQQEAMPREFCIPEPDLFSLAEIPRMDPMVAPPWMARITTSMTKLRSTFKGQRLATKMVWTDSLKNLAEASSALAEKLQWPMLRAFGRDLGRLMFEIGWPSVYHV